MRQVHRAGEKLFIDYCGPTLAMRKDNYIFALTPPGFGHELGHLYSDDVYQGEGLHEAVQQALEYLPAPMKVHRLLRYASRNNALPLLNYHRSRSCISGSGLFNTRKD